MDILFDVLQRTLNIVQNDSDMSYGADINAKLNRYNQTVPLANVEFGFTLNVDDVEIESQSWPPSGVKYGRTDQDILASYRLNWKPDDNVSINVWLIDNAGIRHEDSVSFQAPKPEKPFESWIWENESWQPPVPYPEDGGMYEWDEANLEWVLYTQPEPSGV